MSSPKLNLPMLSDFLLGDVISSHDGVSCFPAIRRGTEEKYILKVISIPASAAKLEALLLTGAMSSKEAALDYYMSLSKDILKQVDILRQLSQQEGFVPYMDGQVLLQDTQTGYDVYLLGTYKQSLERILRTDVLTHADVANLGLDLCAALAACRRTGYLYADLKPGNIFRDPDRGFRIGDVGFISLSSLKYASLPEKYRSRYTAPELADDMAVLNPTVDIYALGLVLYQAYNGGILPYEASTPDEELPPPIYADYEMAEIILKACHPDPKQRWQEPTKMAHALIGYLQTYGAPETPIIPPVLDKQEETPIEEEEPFLPEMDDTQLQQEIEALEFADPDELAFLSGLVNDETAPTEEDAVDAPEDVMSQELSEMFAQADELILHQLPEPPVAPAPVFVSLQDVTQPEEAPDAPQQSLSEKSEENAQFQASEDDWDVPPLLPQQNDPAVDMADEDAPTEPTVEYLTKDMEVDPEAISARRKTILGRILAAAIVIALLAGGWFFGQKYYHEQYLLKVDDLIISYEGDAITVQVLSGIDQQLLQVVCTDTYGNSSVRSLIDGCATFTDLKPSTRYTLRVEASGFHKLTGNITGSITTAAQVQILSFTAGMGPEDCSVALNFTVSGPDTSRWAVRYSADSIAEQTLEFTGRSVVVQGLEHGALYTFTLVSPDGLYVAGQTQAQFMATNILYAQQLTILSCGGGSLTASWAQPQDGEVTQWRVRCYNESGYNVTVTTSDLSYTFTDLDHSTACTVEVTAVGMPNGVSTSITAEPVTVTDFSCSLTDHGTILVTWSYTGTTPAAGWQLSYQVNETLYKVFLQDACGELMAIPGETYQFTIGTAEENYVFNCDYSFTAQDLAFFSGYGITAADLSWMPVLLPDGTDWKPSDFSSNDYRILFEPGQNAGILITSSLRPTASDEVVQIRFVVLDPNGKLVTHAYQEMTWDSLWQKSSCLLPVTALPQEAGTYTVQLYFNGGLVLSETLTMQAPAAPEEPAI